MACGNTDEFGITIGGTPVIFPGRRCILSDPDNEFYVRQDIEDANRNPLGMHFTYHPNCTWEND